MKLYDFATERMWQQFNWFQYQCYINCRLPRYIKKEKKVKTIQPSFAITKKGYTLLFVFYVIEVLKKIQVQQTTADLFKMSSLRSIIKEVVDNGLTKRGYVANLAAYQAASGRDAYSVSIYPQFTDSTMNLNINNPALTQIATSVPEITDDIDGQIRGYFLGIGADEYLLTKTLYLKVFPEGLFNGINLNAAFNETSEQWGAYMIEVTYQN